MCSRESWCLSRASAHATSHLLYYHYCEVPQSIVTAFTMADSMGRYYNAVIKGRFDCRVYRMPSYN